MSNTWFGSFDDFDRNMQALFQKFINWELNEKGACKGMSVVLSFICYTQSVLVVAFLFLALIKVPSQFFLRSFFGWPLVIMAIVFLISFGLNIPCYFKKYNKKALDKVEYWNNEIRRTLSAFFLVFLFSSFVVDKGNNFIAAMAFALFLNLLGSYFSACERRADVFKKEKYSMAE